MRWIALLLAVLSALACAQTRSLGPTPSSLAPGHFETNPQGGAQRAVRLLAEGRDFLATRDWAQAKASFLSALEVRRSLYGPDSLPAAECILRLGEAEFRSSNYRLAYVHLNKVRQRVLQGFSPDATDARYRADLALETARLLSEIGLGTVAVELYTLAVEARIAALGSDHIDTKIARFWLAYYRENDSSDREILQTKSLIDLLQRICVSIHYYWDARREQAGFFYRDDNRVDWTWELAWRILAYQLLEKDQKSVLIELLSRDDLTLSHLHRSYSYRKMHQYELMIDIYHGLGDLGMAGRFCKRMLIYLEDEDSRWRRNGNDPIKAKMQFISNDLRRADVFEKLSALAELKGNIEEAEDYLRRSISARLVNPQDGTLTVADLSKLYPLLAKLAAINWKLGKTEYAEKVWFDALDLLEERLYLCSFVPSEWFLREHLHAATTIANSLLDLLAKETRPQVKDRLARLALTAVLISQGRVADETATQLRPPSDGQSAAALQKQLRELRLQQAALEYGASASQAGETYQKEKETIENNISALEKKIILQTNYSAEKTKPLSQDFINAIRHSLPKDSLFVDYVAYWPDEVFSTVRHRGAQRQYMAFSLDNAGQVSFKALGSAKAIDRASATLYQAIEKRADIASPAQALFREVLAPLLSNTQVVRKLLIIPDGKLNLIPFSILDDGRGKLLIDLYSIHYYGSGRDLLIDKVPNPASSMVVFANPDLNAPHRVTGPSALANQGGGSLLWAMQGQRTVGGLQLDSLDSLPGTEAEAIALQSIFPDAKLFLHDAASEPNLFELPSPPGILHIASHGVYLEDWEDSPAAETTRRLAMVRDLLPPHPLLRSVLILSGALRGRSKFGTPYDGLATAIEIATLSLSGTQLVVLSACESGRGLLLPGEGVAGMRRSFLAAGAETVVASLWRVDDWVTAELMNRFYQLLRQGEGRAEAMRQAAEAVRANFPHPYYWAPFVVVGRGEPLRALPRQ